MTESRYFAWMRMLTGFYLAAHFIYVAPDAPAIWSREGMVSQPIWNATYGYFPNVLTSIDSPVGVIAFVAALGALSLCLAFGAGRRLASVLLWYGCACLFHRNNLVLNPSLPFLGWMLLMFAAIPSGEARSLWPPPRPNWRLPRIAGPASRWLFGLTYSLSGIHKLLFSPSWQDGLAVQFVLESPMARDTLLREWLLTAPHLLAAISWAALAAECLSLPLALWRQTFVWTWAPLTIMHLCLLPLFSFADMTLGMLVWHAWAGITNLSPPKT